MVRPILEYACRYGMQDSGESDLLEQIQKRVIRIIFPESRYIDALESAHMELLSVRRQRLSKQSF